LARTHATIAIEKLVENRLADALTTCPQADHDLHREPCCSNSSDPEILHADKGYDANAIHRQFAGRGALPNIPRKASRKWKNCVSPFLYLNRNAIALHLALPSPRRLASAMATK
jgi:hypothetical protein